MGEGDVVTTAFKDEPVVQPAPEPAHPQSDAAALPPLIQVAGQIAPAAPKSLDDTGVDPMVLSDLALKLASTVPSLTSEWACRQLHLPPALIEKIFWQLKEDHFVEILGQVGEFSYRYATTQRGREHARRSLEVCGYVGPAPVSLGSYAAMLDHQAAARQRPGIEQVRKAIASLVLLDQAVEVAALAASSGRSLFLFGPPGNGKTSLGRALHRVVEGTLWIPHCISIDNHIIRIFDRQCHKLVEDGANTSDRVDHRWLKIDPPFVIAGGEMTMDELDLAYSPSLRFYEAPPHVKANGGTFLIDDLGRQRIDPHELLNRWIIPLEHQVDYMTLTSGQKLQIPFRLMLVVATNLKVSDVADPAFLRRMGYRLLLDRPDEQRYANIFRQYAASVNADVPAGLLEHILARYKAEDRELPPPSRAISSSACGISAGCITSHSR
jgi:hypothetical protein